MILVVITIISWGGNAFYFQSKQLEAPVFFKHYYEEYRNPTFYYITNKNDPKIIQSITLQNGERLYPDSSNGFFNNSPQPSTKARYTHYVMAFTTFNLSNNQYDNIEHRGEATVSFKDGSTITTDIGTLNYHKEQNVANPSVFERTMHASGNNDTESVTSRASENITINGLEFPRVELQEDISIKFETNQEELDLSETQQPGWLSEEKSEDWQRVEGVSYDESLFPISLQKGNWIKVHLHTQSSHYQAYSYYINMLGEKENGEQFRKPLYVSKVEPYLNEDELQDYLKRRHLE